MTLLEIIPYFRLPGQLEAYLKTKGLNNEEGDVSVYLKDCLELNSELQFLNDHQTRGQRIVDYNSSKYEELLPVFMIQEMVEELKDDCSDYQIAERILSYAINDA